MVITPGIEARDKCKSTDYAKGDADSALSLNSSAGANLRA